MRGRRRETKRLRDEASVRRCRREKREDRMQHKVERNEKEKKRTGRERMDEFATGSQ